MSVTVRTEWRGDGITADIVRAVPIAVRQGAIVLQAQMSRQLNNRSPSSPGQSPGVDRGQLRQSVTYIMQANSALVGTPLRYGRWLEYGFTVSPKNVKRLPVPVNRKARRMLRTLDIGETGRVSLKSKNLTFIPRKGKDPLLVEKVSKSGKFSGAIFVLKKRVTVAARPWVLPSVNKARPAIVAAINRTLARELAGGR